MAVSIQQQMRLVGTQFADGKIDHAETRRRLVALIQGHFQCSRVSYWEFSGEPGERVMQCIVACGVETASHVVGKRFFETDAPDYIDSLARKRMYVCEDTLSDPNLMSVRDRFLLPGASRALLDAALAANGKLIGVLCCEQVGEVRKWTRPEIMAAMKFANAISMFIARMNVLAARENAAAAAAAAAG
jgi:GAF domain-containing protein